MLQPSRLAAAKRTSLGAMLLHGLIVFAISVLFSYYFLTAWLVVGLLVVSAFHVGVDISRARRFLARGGESFWLAVLDQGLHLFSLLVLVYFYPSKTINEVGMKNLYATDPYLLNLILLTVSGYIFLLTCQKAMYKGALRLVSLRFLAESEFEKLRTRSASFVSAVESIAAFTLMLSGQWALIVVLAAAILVIRLIPREGRERFPYHVAEIVLHIGGGTLLGVIVLAIA